MHMIGILGAGNLLLTDEGFGIHCVQEIERRYELPENVRLMEGGTAGIMLAPFMEEVDVLYVFDAVNSTERPGTLRCFSQADLCSLSPHISMSPHQLGLMEVLELCRLRGKAPVEVTVITAVPEDLGAGVELSDTLAGSVPRAIEMLRERLLQHGTVLRERESSQGA